MSQPPLSRILEAALLSSNKPLNLERIKDLFEPEQLPSNDALRAALTELGDSYAESAMQLVEVASGWRLQVRNAYMPWVSRLWEERPQRYSRALLETLALVAYRQPITRGEIEDIRGVAVSSQIIRTLVDREWVRVVG
ncbi:MAG: SMC-Scp complex subunit ScpB, partial [Pseudomonadaceae bacterium]